MDLLKDIQTWYKLNCDGDWEHEYGISISTLDNPGWCLKVDLTNTALEGFTFQKEEKITLEDWYEVKVENDVFIGYGDVDKLEKLIEVFLEWLRNALIKSEITYTIYTLLGEYEGISVWRPLLGRMIDINKFVITSRPDFNVKGLKVKSIEHFDQLPLDEIIDKIEDEEGDIVSCDMVMFYDYPGLVIKNKIYTTRPTK